MLLKSSDGICVTFNSVLGASGVEGFFGEGYRHHRLFRYFGLDFSGMTFVAKTTTLHANQGNMPLTEHYTPREWNPKCVVVKPLHNTVLNAVGLSGPGLQKLLAMDKWQMRREPFMLSFAAIAATPEERIAEAIACAELLANEQRNFRASFGLQVNISCPNTAHAPEVMASEAEALLAAISTRLHGVPLMAKLSAITPVEVAKKITDSPFCAGLCVSNTIPFGMLPTHIPWERLFGTLMISPLKARVDQLGGLSGKFLFPIVVDWIERARELGITKPINAGGGIMAARHINRLRDAGASSCFLGSVAITRPWRVASLVRFAKDIKWRS